MKSPIEKRSIVVGGPPDFFDIDRSALKGEARIALPTPDIQKWITFDPEAEYVGQFRVASRR